jgi:hypothetical protein
VEGVSTSLVHGSLSGAFVGFTGTFEISTTAGDDEVPGSEAAAERVG